jgi:hypothetical protein
MRNPFTRDGYTGQTPLRVCPFCSYTLDAVTNLTGQDQPQEGDFTVCIGCRGVLRFGHNLTLHKSSLMEVPTHLRMSFAKVIRVAETMPKPKRSSRSGPPSGPGFITLLLVLISCFGFALSYTIFFFVR